MSLPGMHLWSFHGQAGRYSHSVLNRDLAGMVRMEEGQVSGPEVSTCLGCVGHRGQAHILCFTGHWLWKATWKEHRILN